MPAYVGKRSIYAKASLDRPGVALSSYARQAGHVEGVGRQAVFFAQSSALSPYLLTLNLGTYES
jgi:aminopeptidase N